MQKKKGGTYKIGVSSFRETTLVLKGESWDKSSINHNRTPKLPSHPKIPSTLPKPWQHYQSSTFNHLTSKDCLRFTSRIIVALSSREGLAQLLQQIVGTQLQLGDMEDIVDSTIRLQLKLIDRSTNAIQNLERAIKLR